MKTRTVGVSLPFLSSLTHKQVHKQKSTPKAAPLSSVWLPYLLLMLCRQSPVKYLAPGVASGPKQSRGQAQDSRIKECVWQTWVYLFVLAW